MREVCIELPVYLHPVPFIILLVLEAYLGKTQYGSTLGFFAMMAKKFIFKE